MEEGNSVVSRFALHSSLRQVGRAFGLTFTWGYTPGWYKTRLQRFKGMFSGRVEFFRSLLKAPLGFCPKYAG